MKKFALALFSIAAILTITPVALAGTITLCPDTTPGWQDTNGGATVVNIPGSPGSCGTATFYVPNDSTSNVTQWFTTDGLTLGNLVSLDASVVFTADVATDQPYFLLEVDDLSSLMLEFQPSGNLSGNDMIVDPSTTLFNLWDYNDGEYDIEPGGQSDAHTLDYWIENNPTWSNFSIEYAGVGTGLDGGCTAPCTETLTVNSLEVTTTPEPGSLLLFGTGLVGLAGMLRRKLRG